MRKVLSGWRLSATILATGLTLFYSGSPNPVSRETRGAQVESVHRAAQVQGITRANEILRNFPDKLPGANEVRKYETPGAKYCLVHILSIHYSEDAPDWANNLSRPVQDDIYETLSYLVDNYGLRDLYSEGVMPSIEEFFRKPGNVNKVSKCRGTEDFELIKTHSGLFFVMGDEKARKDSANERLASEGRINLKATTTTVHETLARREKFTNMILNIDEFGIAVMDSRENIALRFIADSGYIPSREDENLAVIVFGGLHAFGGKESCGPNYPMDGRISHRDNIAVWNRSHTNKFSLIEVVPCSYKGVREEIDRKEKESVEMEKVAGEAHTLMDQIEREQEDDLFIGPPLLVSPSVDDLKGD